jgi:hypothetical protein
MRESSSNFDVDRDKFEAPASLGQYPTVGEDIA